MWVTSQTRPHASLDSCRISNYEKNPKVKNLPEANKAVRKSQSSILRLFYPDIGNPEYLKVIVCGCDPRKLTYWSVSRCPDSVFCGNNGAVPITWKSKK